MISVLVTGFVNTAVPTRALKYINDKTDEDLNIMCTTGIVDIQIIDTHRIKQMVMGHFGLVPKFHDAIRSGEIHAVNIPQGIFTQLLIRQIVFSTIGLGTYLENDLGVLSPTSSNGHVQASGREMCYMIERPEFVLVKANIYYDKSGRVDFGDGLLFDRLDAINMGARVILDCVVDYENEGEEYLPVIYDDVITV